MSGPTEAGSEFRVVWRWKTDRYRDEFSDERTKVYKTLAGAQRLQSKLLSNGGKYEKHTEYEPTRYDDGYRVEHWSIDYVRVERRPVGEWVAA